MHVLNLTDSHSQTIQFQIDEKYKKILINCSGGADSTLLLYMTCDYIKRFNLDTTVSLISCSVANKSNLVAKLVANIVDYTVSKLGDGIITNHYSLYRSSGLDEHLHPFQKQLFEQNNMDILFGGITANPKEETYVTKKNGTTIELRADCNQILWERNKASTRPELVVRDSYPYYNPFVNVDKRFVADMYKQYEIEDLIPLTRTCNVVNPQAEPCGNCWSCCERKWAFGTFF